MRTESRTITLFQENGSFLDAPPFQESRRHARDHGYDLAVPNNVGIGNVLAFTPLVEEYARALGRRIDLLTAPISPEVGVVEHEEAYPVWANNPYVRTIGNADELDENIMWDVGGEMDNCCQSGHVIENICSEYGVRPRALRPSIYLSRDEMAWALDELAPYPRPIIALHPYSTSAPSEGHPWHRRRWLQLAAALNERGTVLEIHKHGADDRGLPTLRISTTLRQMFALIWASDLFIGLDSSPSHVATAFCKPAVVLWEPLQKLYAEERCQAGFGPAVLRRWGYPQNLNLFLLGERGNEVIDQVLDFVDLTLYSSRVRTRRHHLHVEEPLQAGMVSLERARVAGG